MQNPVPRSYTATGEGAGNFHSKPTTDIRLPRQGGTELLRKPNFSDPGTHRASPRKRLDQDYRNAPSLTPLQGLLKAEVGKATVNRAQAPLFRHRQQPLGNVNLVVF